VSGWRALEEELDRWAAAGRVAELWWRDDDARRPGAALGRLLALARRHRLGPGLAIIPEGADPGLAAALDEAPGAVALQHGYAHRDHARRGEKRIELDGHRRPEAVLGELAAGRATLEGLLGERLLPVLVPPWNRIAAPLVARLEAAGYRVLSGFGARRAGTAGPRAVNTHVDLIDWRGGRGGRPPEAVAAALVAHLRARRRARVDPGEPTGILSHHRDHDERCWAVLEGLLERVEAHPGGRWLDAREALGR